PFDFIIVSRPARHLKIRVSAVQFCPWAPFFPMNSNGCFTSITGPDASSGRTRAVWPGGSPAVFDFSGPGVMVT
ncbi:MAG: hypothetical protein VCD66_02995, partial [Alphaproteobacteria bacterium]